MLKFESTIIFLIFGRSPIYTITFYSLMATLFIIKFGSDRMKSRGGDQADSLLSTTHGYITDCKLDSVVYTGVCVVI